MSDTTELPASLTLALPKPIDFDGQQYTQLILREPKVKDVLRAAEQLRNGVTMAAMINQKIHLLALVAGVPVPVIEATNISILNKGIAYLDPFLTDGQGTGGS